MELSWNFGGTLVGVLGSVLREVKRGFGSVLSQFRFCNMGKVSQEVL